jgi:2-polyprenyl-3-methyl-5-hydroxy-6-metoxy-1,4-benzoquinol methylase
MNPMHEWNDLDPYYSATYEAYESDHGSTTENDRTAIEESLAAREFRHLALPIEGKVLLDVGCGGGWFLRVASRLGAMVQGVEPSRAGFHQTRQQGIPVFHGMLDEFVGISAAKRFDIITANHVLEHVPDPVSTLRMMRSLLAPGGYIWISVPNADNYFARRLGKHWHSIDLPYHLQQFTLGSLELAATRAGLKIRRSYTFSTRADVAASLRHHLRRRYFLPQRVSEKWAWLNKRYASHLARTLDERRDGSAALMEVEA